MRSSRGKKKKKSPPQYDRNRQVATRPSPLVSCFLCSADRCMRRDLLAASFLSPAAAAPGTRGVPCGRMWYQHPKGSETLQKGLLRFPPAPPRWPQATQGVRSPPCRWQLPKEDLDAHVAQDSAGPTCRGVGQKVVLQEWCKPNSLPQAGVEGAESPVRLDGAPPPTRPAHLKPTGSKDEGAQATHLLSG